MIQPESASVGGVRFPPQYGTPAGEEARVPWSSVDQRLRAAPNYWVATVTPTGRPHVRPVDGVWVEGALCFGGSPETRWVRNLHANPAITVNLGGDNDVVILEGSADYITDPEHPLARPSTEASVAKSPQYYPGGVAPPFRPLWALRPSRVYAWSLDQFPVNATRWQFDHWRWARRHFPGKKAPERWA